MSDQRFFSQARYLPPLKSASKPRSEMLVRHSPIVVWGHKSHDVGRMMTCRAYESSRKCKHTYLYASQVRERTHALLTRLMRYSSSTDTQSSFYQHLVMLADTSLSYRLPTSKSMATCNYEMCHVWNDYQWEHSARFHRTFVVACCTGRIISFVEDEHRI
jgi:hypothetical protein